MSFVYCTIFLYIEQNAMGESTVRFLLRKSTKPIEDFVDFSYFIPLQESLVVKVLACWQRNL